jgi:alpha-beta hydrolase superfamily lysophospholipase
MRTWLPRGRPRRAVVALHGMVTHAGWFAQLGDLLVAQGIALVAPDRRGNGLARELGQVGNAALLISDALAVVQAAREMSDDVTLFSWCGSANFAVPAAVRAPIRRFVLASPGLVPLAEMSARFRASQPVDGRLPIHFDPAADFTDDAEVQAMIRADELYLRWIPVEVRDAWKQLNPIAREALRALPVPTRCVLTRVDRMIDIPQTALLLADIPIEWTCGGHGFLVEPAGARFVANLLAS